MTVRLSNNAVRFTSSSGFLSLQSSNSTTDRLLVSTTATVVPQVGARFTGNFTTSFLGAGSNLISGFTTNSSNASPDTIIRVLPNGTGTAAYLQLYNSDGATTSWWNFTFASDGGEPYAWLNRASSPTTPTICFAAQTLNQTQNRVFVNGQLQCNIGDGGVTNLQTLPNGTSPLMALTCGGFTHALSLNLMDQGNFMTPFTQYILASFGSTTNSILGVIRTTTTEVFIQFLSDYRRKTNVAAMTDGLNKVLRLKPCRFLWKDQPDDTPQWGFLAHEVQEVYGRCVNGQKDAVEKNGDIKGQMLDVVGLTPMLVAAVKELRASLASIRDDFETIKGQTT